MKSTDNFKKAIKKHLDEKAKQDVLFDKKYKNEGKSISECIQFIINTVQKSGKCALTDDEVYGMAIHYYDEKDLKVEKPMGARVVCSSDNLSDEDKINARAAAVAEYQEEIKNEMMQKAKSRRSKKQSSKNQVQQPTLF